jgi:acetylornithine deacetylase
VSDVVELTRALVRIPTHHPDGDELALCRHVAPLLAARGAEEVRIVETGRGAGGPGGYVYARWGTPRLMFNAHVDTVPPNTGWTRGPWDAALEGGRVWGLGSADTKGAIAAILDATARQRPKDLAVLFSGDEERGTASVTHFLKSVYKDGLTHAIVCEPSARRAGVRHRGVLAEIATVRGAGGHSSNADRMPAPIVTMAKVAVVLDELGRDARDKGPDDMKGLAMNVAAIEGGVAFNVVADAASCLYSIRPAPGFDREAWQATLRARTAAIDPEITWTTRTIHAPFACSDRATLEGMLGAHVEGFVPLDYWTEAALYEAAGISAVVVGPGDIKAAHAPDESCSVADLEWAAAAFADVIAKHAS